MTRRETACKETGELVESINAKLRGWANYFSLDSVSKAYRVVDSHTRHRRRQWLCNKHKIQGQGGNFFRDQDLHEQLGLMRIVRLTANLPLAKT